MLLLLALGHLSRPPALLPGNFRTTQRILLPLPPSLLCHQSPCTGSLGPPLLRDRPPREMPPTPGRPLSVHNGASASPSLLPPPSHSEFPTECTLSDSVPSGPAFTGQGQGHPQEKSLVGGETPWCGCRAVATVMEPVCARRDSCQRGWRPLHIAAAYHSCSEVLQPHLTHFLQDVVGPQACPSRVRGKRKGTQARG